MDLDDKIHEAENPIKTKFEKGKIEFKNVSFGYEKNNKNFKDLSFSLEAG